MRCLFASVQSYEILQYQMYKGVSGSKVMKNCMSLWFISVVLITDVTWLITFGERRAKSTMGVWNLNLRSSQVLFFNFFFYFSQTMVQKIFICPVSTQHPKNHSFVEKILENNPQVKPRFVHCFTTNITSVHPSQLTHFLTPNT